ncbi:hypothetical protein R6Q59_023616 [Mikania micrantha]
MRESDTDVEEERIQSDEFVEERKKQERQTKKGKFKLFDSDSEDEEPLLNLKRKVDCSTKPDATRAKKIVHGQAKFYDSGHEKGTKRITLAKMVWQQTKKVAVTEASASKKWMVLNTRSSIAQVFRCVKLLRDNQKKGVRQIGFGKLLKFNMDGIPSRMTHFVVDRLKGKRMEIIYKGGCLKIIPQLIHKLLGAPIGGVKIESIVTLEVLDYSVCQWRRQYEGRLQATRQIVEKIKCVEDENTFDFRMDFLILFLAVLVECHKNGRVRENILCISHPRLIFQKLFGVITYSKG